MALQFLLNLVGDIHDPLFAIERNDQSGRCVAVLPPGSKTPVRLSVYWEDDLVAEAEGKNPAKAAEQIAARLTAVDIRKWSGGTPEEWARESYELAKSVVYGFPAEAGGQFSFPARKGEADACGRGPAPPAGCRLSRPRHRRGQGAVGEGRCPSRRSAERQFAMSLLADYRSLAGRDLTRRGCDVDRIVVGSGEVFDCARNRPIEPIGQLSDLRDRHRPRLEVFGTLAEHPFEDESHRHAARRHR